MTLLELLGRFQTSSCFSTRSLSNKLSFRIAQLGGKRASGQATYDSESFPGMIHFNSMASGILSTSSQPS